MMSMMLTLCDHASVPFIQVYLDATGSVGGAQALTAVLILLIFFGAANFMASASRQTFAFARDGGLPFSRQISKVLLTIDRRCMRLLTDRSVGQRQIRSAAGSSGRGLHCTRSAELDRSW